MVISDARFAAALADERGEVFKFDDIGCMQIFEKKNNTKPRYAWVHDYESQQWIAARDAILSHSGEIITPMGYGIIAKERRRE